MQNSILYNVYAVCNCHITFSPVTIQLKNNVIHMFSDVKLQKVNPNETHYAVIYATGQIYSILLQDRNSPNYIKLYQLLNYCHAPLRRQ